MALARAYGFHAENRRVPPTSRRPSNVRTLSATGHLSSSSSTPKPHAAPDLDAMLRGGARRDRDHARLRPHPDHRRRRRPRPPPATGLAPLADRLRLVDVKEMGAAAAHEEVVVCDLADQRRGARRHPRLRRDRALRRPSARAELRGAGRRRAPGSYHMYEGARPVVQLLVHPRHLILIFEVGDGSAGRGRSSRRLRARRSPSAANRRRRPRSRRPSSASSRRTIAIRSSTENIGDLEGLVVTPMTSRSTSFAPRRMISIWPSVIGSNVPG